MKVKEVSCMCTRLHQEDVFKTMLVENDRILLITKLLVARAAIIQLKGFVEPKNIIGDDRSTQSKLLLEKAEPRFFLFKIIVCLGQQPIQNA